MGAKQTSIDYSCTGDGQTPYQIEPGFAIRLGSRDGNPFARNPMIGQKPQRAALNGSVTAMKMGPLSTNQNSILWNHKGIHNLGRQLISTNNRASFGRKMSHPPPSENADITGANPILWHRGWAIVFIGFAVVFSGIACRCPWTATNTDLINSSGWIQNGMHAFHQGETDQAQKYLGKAVRARPHDPMLREHLADVLVEQGRTEEAIDHMMRAAEISGPNAPLFTRIGQLYLRRGQWPAADQYARRALQVDRQNAEAWVLRADTRLAKGEWSLALSDYQRALSLQPNLPDVQLQVARIYHQMGDPLRAFSMLERMLAGTAWEQQPAEVLLLSGRLLIELDRPMQALERLQLATARTSATADSFLQLARAQMMLGRTVDAQATLATGLRLHPDDSKLARQIPLLVQDGEVAALDRSSAEIIR